MDDCSLRRFDTSGQHNATKPPFVRVEEELERSSRHSSRAPMATTSFACTDVTHFLVTYCCINIQAFPGLHPFSLSPYRLRQSLHLVP